MGGRIVRWFRWTGPAHTERSWRERAGPFTRVEIRVGGEHRVLRFEQRTQLVVGPWEVWIFGLDAWGARRTLDRWSVHYAWVTDEGTSRVATGDILGRILGGYRTHVMPLASEVRFDRIAWSSEGLRRGASEWRWLGASESWLGGASEQLRLGASELRFLGASELGWVGASEQRFVGASERLLGGASELAMGGEGRFPESSPLGGASEWLRGASPGGRPRTAEGQR
jgi:hypothetical protein